MTEFLTFMLPILVAAVTTYLFEGLQKVVALIDGLPAVVKQVAVAAIAFGLTKLSVLLGIQLTTTDVAGLQPADVSALASAGLAYVFHLGQQAKAMKANTA